MLVYELSGSGLFMKFYNRGGSRAAATSKMECFVIIVNGFQPVKQPGKHIVAIHILSNISRSKGNQSENEIWSVNTI